MDVPKGLKYHEDHLWIKIEGDRGRVGITDFAQDQLGEILNVELVRVGIQVKRGTPMGIIESSKAAYYVPAPVSGEILEINEILIHQPYWINQDPYGKGWMILLKMTSPEELGALMSDEQYLHYILGRREKSI